MQGVTSSSFLQQGTPLLSASREGRAVSLPEVVPATSWCPCQEEGWGGAVWQVPVPLAGQALSAPYGSVGMAELCLDCDSARQGSC